MVHTWIHPTRPRRNPDGYSSPKTPEVDPSKLRKQQSPGRRQQQDNSCQIPSWPWWGTRLRTIAKSQLVPGDEAVGAGGENFHEISNLWISLNMSWRHMSWACPEHILNMSWSCMNMSWTCPEHVLELHTLHQHSLEAHLHGLILTCWSWFGNYNIITFSQNRILDSSNTSISYPAIVGRL